MEKQLERSRAVILCSKQVVAGLTDQIWLSGSCEVLGLLWLFCLSLARGHV